MSSWTDEVKAFGATSETSSTGKECPEVCYCLTLRLCLMSLPIPGTIHASVQKAAPLREAGIEATYRR